MLLHESRFKKSDHATSFNVDAASVILESLDIAASASLQGVLMPEGFEAAPAAEAQQRFVFLA